MSKAHKTLKHNALAIACCASLVDLFTHSANVSVMFGEEKSATSTGIRDTIIAMRDAYGSDTSGYLGACVEVFGNGERGKLVADGGKRIAGTLRDALTKAGISLDLVKWQLGESRGVANYLADPDAKRTDDKGELLPMRTLYKLSHADTPKKGRGPTKVVAPAPSNESIAQYIARVGIVAVGAEMARILKSDKRTRTDGIAMDAIVEHVGAGNAIAS